jgi:hypothetical protein
MKEQKSLSDMIEKTASSQSVRWGWIPGGALKSVSCEEKARRVTRLSGIPLSNRLRRNADKKTRRLDRRSDAANLRNWEFQNRATTTALVYPKPAQPSFNFAVVATLLRRRSQSRIPSLLQSGLDGTRTRRTVSLHPR